MQLFIFMVSLGMNRFEVESRVVFHASGQWRLRAPVSHSDASQEVFTASWLSVLPETLPERVLERKSRINYSSRGVDLLDLDRDVISIGVDITIVLFRIPLHRGNATELPL